MKNLNQYILETKRISLINDYILEAKEKVEVGGLTFKEGDRAIYLKKFKDENGDEYEEEIEGTISEILPSKKINFEFGEDKFVVIQASDLVGLCKKSKTYQFKTSSKIENKYYDELDDINYEIDQKMNEINDLNNDMEEAIIEIAREAWLKDNPDKKPDDFNTSDQYNYIEKATQEWTETYGLNDLEKELEDLESKRDKIQKKLDDYLAKDGKTVSKNGRIQYIKGYEPIE